MQLYVILGILALGSVAVSNAARQYKMVCYYSSWATYRNGNGRFTASDIDPQLCTHLIYAFAGLDNNFQIRILDPWLSLTDGGGKGDFRLFNSLKDRNRDLKLMLGVGGWNEGSSRYSQMAAVPRNRKTFIDSAIALVRNYGFDGINLDWQYPGNRGGLGVDKINYVTLLKEFREALTANNLAFGISAAGNKEIVDMGYNVPEVTKYVDYVSLLTYDYHGSWDVHTGMNSPLYAQKGASFADKDLTQDATVQHWIKKGADKSKLLLGLATYGRTYVLRDRSLNKLGDPSFRPGNPGRYTQQDGFLGYNEILEKFADYPGWVLKYDEDTKVPFAYNEDQWISFDNEWSFGLKAQYIKQQGLGGAMIWSLDTDDYLGQSGRANPLINTVKDVLEDGKIGPTAGPDQGTPGTVGPVTPRPGRFECKGLGTFQHPEDCTKFYTCIVSVGGYEPVVNSCPPGLAFDNVTKACNWRDAVPECR